MTFAKCTIHTSDWGSDPSVARACSGKRSSKRLRHAAMMPRFEVEDSLPDCVKWHCRVPNELHRWRRVSIPWTAVFR